MSEFMRALLRATEKAANIARACRQEKELFQLLVQEKVGLEKNERFFQDFKTLADVLVQETIKHDLEKQFPVLVGHIHGEESNRFTNTLGRSIAVEVKETEEETAALLVQVLGGDEVAAGALARLVHADVQEVDETGLEDFDTQLPLHEIALWIDPIDSTSEYIHGRSPSGEHPSPALQSSLHCVTVLLGAYLRTSGLPLAGIVNQPFHHQADADEGPWVGKAYWGICHEGVHVCSASRAPRMEEPAVVLVSKIESSDIIQALSQKFQVIPVSGAGYKMLCVTIGLADAFVLSQGSTFYWDTCAPHAILRASGGKVVGYSGAVRGSYEELRYHLEEKGDGRKWSNKNGIIAVRERKMLEDIVEMVRSCTIGKA